MKLDEAIAEYRIAERLQPNSADFHIGLGEIFEHQEKMDEAIAEYRTAIRLRPNYANAHNDLAWAMIKKPDRSAQEQSEALEHSRQAVALAPGRAASTTRWPWPSTASGTGPSRSPLPSGRSLCSREWMPPTGFFWLWPTGGKANKDRARSFFDQAVVWTRKNDPKNAELLQFWREAAELLGRPGPSAAALPNLPANPFAP